VQVSRAENLDIVHAHYAIPHASAGYLARQILAATEGACVPRVITTLHGTDITLLGADRSYSEIVAFSIEQSDGVTAVSESLKTDTYRELGVSSEIRVIPNFVDCSVYKRRDASALRARLAPNHEKLIVHISNFRPVKRVAAAVEVFARVAKKVPARLLMVGDGPDLADASRLAEKLGVSAGVEFLGEQEHIVQILSASDVFLLPSAQESFGLAALEAMSCEVPIIASRVGGLPEVIQDGVTGFLHAPDDLDGMADSAVRLLTDPALHARTAEAARASARRRFCDDKIVPIYEHFYEEVLAK
jgi:N-acetyl-alpha-D-glucosaminyl L-malate synthase BshA